MESVFPGPLCQGAGVDDSAPSAVAAAAAASSRASTGQLTCSGCGRVIKDRWLLSAVDRYWHEHCLRCSYCHCALADVGTTLFSRADLLLCRRDYLRLFGTGGYCSYCERSIAACDMVMTAKEHVYHLECFACFKCQHRFCIGDRYYLLGVRILCETDYEEHLLQLRKQYEAYNGHLHPADSMSNQLAMDSETTSSMGQSLSWYQPEPSRQSVPTHRFHIAGDNPKSLDDRSSGYGSPSPPCA